MFANAGYGDLMFTPFFYTEEEAKYCQKPARFPENPTCTDFHISHMPLNKEVNATYDHKRTIDEDTYVEGDYKASISKPAWPDEEIEGFRGYEDLDWGSSTEGDWGES